MDKHQKIIEQFYTAFKEGDAARMTSFYHSDIVFKDPAFGILKGTKAKAMWNMLISSSKGDLKITFDHVVADNNKGTASWTAHYNFGLKRRKVTNHVKANFEFKDDLIIKHTDNFSFKVWARQALGLTGWILGSTKYLQRKVQATVNSRLEHFISK